MTFLNASLIFALAAAAVPIVLHLVARREPKKVVFPSIRFLTKKHESNRSKLQVRRWWLLAMRIAALALLAIALARPAIHRSLSLSWLTIGIVALIGVVLLVLATLALSRGQSKGLTYGLTAAALVSLLTAVLWGGYSAASGQPPPMDNASPAAIAIVVDNSPTSAWESASDARLKRIQDVSRWMISRLPPTSRIAIVDRSSIPVTFSLDAASALAKIDQLQTLQVTQPIADRMDAAARLVRTSDLENRQLLVVTDLTGQTWGESRLGSQLAASLAESPTVPVTLFDLGEFDSTNRVLGPPKLSDSTPPAGAPVKITTTLSLFEGDASVKQSVTVDLSLYENSASLPVVRDGKVQRPKLRNVDRSNVSLAPGEKREIVLTVPPLTTGMHHGVVQLIGDDAMLLDDKRYFSVEVLPPSTLLVIGDDEEQADTIAKVLTASMAADESASEYDIQRIGFRDMLAAELADFDSVFVLDPPADTLRDEMLSQYVAGGGSVFMAMGPNAGLQLIQSDALPTFVRPWRVPEPFTFLTVVQSAHPILAELSEFGGGVPWGDFPVEQYWQTETDAADRVLMQYAGTKHAALIERIVTSKTQEEDLQGMDASPGRWLILTTPIPDTGDPSKQWNGLFGPNAWPAFLLVRFIAEHVTGRGSHSWTSVVGQPQVIQIPDAIDSQAERIRLQLFPPGESLPVPIDVDAAATEVVVADVAKSGTYWLRGASPAAGFSANLPEQATQTERIDPSLLDDWFGAGAYAIATNRDEVELAEVSTTQRVSLRSPLMLLALAVFLMELILGNRFYRNSRGRSQSTGKGAVAV